MKKDITILDAGLGLRLRPLTDSVPKCLVTVNGAAMIERVLSKINRALFWKITPNNRCHAVN